MSYSMSEIEISFNKQMTFNLLLNLRQRNYVLSRPKNEIRNFMNGLGNCGDVQDYFSKFFLDNEMKAWV